MKGENVKISEDPRFQREYPEKYNWYVLDSHKVTPIVSEILSAISFELLKNPELRFLLPGLRLALIAVANNSEVNQ